MPDNTVLSDNICHNMDDGKLVAAVYVDLSEVFGTIGYSFVDVTRGDKRFLIIF